MKVQGSDFRVGRVLHEDDELITLEVAKNRDRELHVEGNDRFLTLLFVKAAPTVHDPNHVKAWLPWTAEGPK